MSEFFWPDDADLGARARRAWTAVVEGLPVGTRVSGVVIGRQPFGVFIQIDQVPDAVGLVRVTALPPDVELPLRGVHVVGDVLWHEERNCQVTVTPVGYRQDVACPPISDAELLDVKRRLLSDRNERQGR
ncbi:hypothetical protein [Nocardia sp. NBC_01327]|uniref:hypothetical protein n=1 Tax=Nocardia sp. NBC_01327 TaxID=2903593 RepID=UPI002E109B2A|nr:hypothetical protein OG326_17755 [Nocardia sp. NBC_01327]